MIGMQYNLQGKVVLEVAGFGSLSPSEAKWKKKEGSFASNEPISVRDIRSPSPSTSTSTLSSSIGGGGPAGGGGGFCGGSGSADNTASLAAVTDSNLQPKWAVSMPPENGSAAVLEAAGFCGGRKDEWASELQPIPAGQEVFGGERFGLGLEDWDTLLSESGQDQSLLRWIASEVDDGSFNLKQLLQGTNPNDFDGNVAIGVVHQSSGVIPAAAGESTGNAMASLAPVLSCGGSGLSSINYHNDKIGSTTLNSSSGIGNCKAADLGLSTAAAPFFGSSLNNPVPNALIYQQQQLETPDEKPQIFNPQVFVNHQQLSQATQSQNFFPPSLYAQQDPLRLLQPNQKRQNIGASDPRSHHPKVPFIDPGHDFLHRKQQQPPQLPMGFGQQRQKQSTVPKQEVAGGGEQMAARHHHNHHHHHYQQQQQVIDDQLYNAAELILAGNFSHAQGILARLNHQLSPVSKPFQRVSFYFKEALQLALLMPNSATSLPPRTPTPLDGMFKMGAYKLLTEISPLLQFMNFTSNQCLLEALDDAEHVHVMDFDIGFGAQWASFMQELPGRNRGTPSLKITAFASPSTHHPIELSLMHENLTQFANEIGVNFALEVVNFDVFEPNSYSVPLFRSSEKEAIVVNFPIWACSTRLSVLPSLLQFIKQLSPRIVVSLERGCERSDLPFSHHLLNALKYYEVLLDSIDAANPPSEVMNKIERFILQPRIESIVMGRLHSPDQMPHWKSLFASAGFSPISFSNFAETQAECVLKRSQVRGFHVEKRQASLVLYWQHQELMLASAWK
ncbi:hypothetical protein U1Q18_019402 [Sarracenia purpurea var. burkii]